MQFEDSVLIRSISFNEQQIFDYKADIFVYETVKRFIGGLTIPYFIYLLFCRGYR